MYITRKTFSKILCITVWPRRPTCLDLGADATDIFSEILHGTQGGAKVFLHPELGPMGSQTWRNPQTQWRYLDGKFIEMGDFPAMPCLITGWYWSHADAESAVKVKRKTRTCFRMREVWSRLNSFRAIQQRRKHSKPFQKTQH